MLIFLAEHKIIERIVGYPKKYFSTLLKPATIEFSISSAKNVVENPSENGSGPYEITF